MTKREEKEKREKKSEKIKNGFAEIRALHFYTLKD